MRTLSGVTDPTGVKVWQRPHGLLLHRTSSSTSSRDSTTSREVELVARDLNMMKNINFSYQYKGVISHQAYRQCTEQETETHLAFRGRDHLFHQREARPNRLRGCSHGGNIHKRVHLGVFQRVACVHHLVQRSGEDAPVNIRVDSIGGELKLKSLNKWELRTTNYKLRTET